LQLPPFAKETGFFFPLFFFWKAWYIQWGYNEKDNEGTTDKHRINKNKEQKEQDNTDKAEQQVN